MKVTLDKSGENFVFLLPKEAVAGLGWNHGDICECTAEGETLQFKRTMTAYEHAMQIARRAMVEYHDTLAALAKS